MPRRPDIESVCLIGSGPIVIGQACEFDYAGCQALKVLREDGFKTIVVNSNPATIMTDPGFADRTYLEPLDLEGVTGVLERERPDALLPTMGGQTALNLAVQLGDAGILDDLGVELIKRRSTSSGGPGTASAWRPCAQQSLRVPESIIVTATDALPADLSLPVILRPAFTLGGHGGGTAHTREARPAARAGAPEPRRPGARRGVAPRLGRVRARADARPRGQRRRRLLDREHRSDGRPHRRLGDRCAPDDAVRRRLPGAARRRDRGHPRRRRRLRRLEHPVRPQPRERGAARDRDEPTGLPLVRPGLEGDGLRIAKVAAKLAVGYTLDEIPNDAGRRPQASSRPSTTSSSSSRASRSRSSPAPTRRSARR